MANIAAGVGYDGLKVWEITGNQELALKLPLGFNPVTDYVSFNTLSFRVLDENRGILHTRVYHEPNGGASEEHNFISVVDLTDGALLDTVPVSRPNGDVGLVVATPRYALMYTTAPGETFYEHTMHIIDTDDLSITALPDSVLLSEAENWLSFVWSMTVDEELAVVNHLIQGQQNVITGVYNLALGETVWERDLSELVTLLGGSAFPENIDTVNGVIYVRRFVDNGIDVTLWVDLISVEDGTITSVETDYTGSLNNQLRHLRLLSLSHGAVTGVLVLDTAIGTNTANIITTEGVKISVPPSPEITEAINILTSSKQGGVALPAAHIQDKTGLHFIPVIWEEE